MRSIRILLAALLLASCGGGIGTAPAPAGRLVFEEPFQRLTVGGTLTNFELQCKGRTVDPDIGPAAVNIPGRWGTLSQMAGDSPLPNVTGAGNAWWSVRDGVLYWHAEQRLVEGRQSDGFALITGQTLDRTRPFTMRLEFTVTAAGRGGYVALAALHSESDYRAVAGRQQRTLLRGNFMEVHRVAPCEENQVGNAKVDTGEWHVLRLDWDPDGCRWTYSLDGEVYQVENGGEGACLAGDPHIALYFATGGLDAIAEGELRNLQVWN